MSKAIEKVIIIPLRRESTRLPEKIFSVIKKQMLCEHVLSQALEVASEESLVIAAVDDKKTDALLKERFPKLQVVMSPPELPSGTDRIHYVITKLHEAKKLDWNKLRCILNIQGDMPFLDPSPFKEFLKNCTWELNSKTMASFYQKWPQNIDAHNPSAVKVVTDQKNKALYFSRFPIPVTRSKDYNILKHHIGVYAYTPNALKEFCHHSSVLIENSEKLEQLRALHLNIPIYMHELPEREGYSFRGIDTKEDLDWAETFAFRG